jgi:hypothetical protein
MESCALLAMVLPVLFLVGCGSATPSDTEPHRMTDAERQAFREAWGSAADPGAISHPQSVPIASGPAPLAYITDHACTVWITDNAGHQWGPVAVPARTVVRVADETGVAAGKIRLASGPLAEGRIYTINLGVPEERAWRNGRMGGQPASGAGDGQN